MDIRSIDLNLLVVFDALARLRNVTRAAEELGMSQPATSAALGRLRARFDDPLFVRAGQEMKPTPRATDLSGPIRLVLDTIDTQVLRLASFDPGAARRTFHIVTPDIGEIAFMPRLAEACGHIAPGVVLRSQSMPRELTRAALESGDADLALGYFPDLRRPGLFQQRLFRTPYVCVTAGTLPRDKTDFTLREYLAARHVVVRPQGRAHLFEQFLEKKRITRNVVLEVSHFMSLTEILLGTELVATVPQDIAAVIARHASLRVLQLPLHPPTIDVQQFWHRRFNNDPANRWLRGLVHGLFRR